MRATSATIAALIIGVAWAVMELARGLDALLERIKK